MTKKSVIGSSVLFMNVSVTHLPDGHSPVLCGDMGCNVEESQADHGHGRSDRQRGDVLEHEADDA